jgi:hypothetical protein
MPYLLCARQRQAIENAAAAVNKLCLADTTVDDYTRPRRVAHIALHDMDANHYHASVLTQMHRILRGIDDVPEMSAIVLQYSKIESLPTQPPPSFLPISNSTLLLITLPSIKPIAYVPRATVQDIMLPTIAPRRSYSKTVASIQPPLMPSVNSATTTSEPAWWRTQQKSTRTPLAAISNHVQGARPRRRCCRPFQSISRDNCKRERLVVV